MIRVVDAEFVLSAKKPEHYPTEAFADFVFCGRSNVGKSSILNTLMNRKKLARMSKRPGRTQMINFFKVRYKVDEADNGYMNFVDLPGYGYAKVSLKEKASWDKMIVQYLQERTQIRGIFAIVDIRRKNPDPKDVALVETLFSLKMPFIILANKCDKLSKNKIKEHIEKLSIAFNVDKEFVVPFSAKSKKGVNRVMNWINDNLFFNYE